MSSLAAIDDETHLSCSYLDSGLSFGFFQVYACGIVHDGIHPPVLIDNFKGGPIPWDTVQAARTEIIRQNQNGGHPNCRGCVHLTRRKKSPGSSRVDWLGLQHWQGCNLDCHYCSLNTRRSAPVRPPPGMPLAHYKVGETLESLIAEKRLDANAVIDWGGGGEPLLMPEFNSAFRLLARLGADQWLHTNGTVFPICLKKDASNLSRVHVICSLDSGTRETYRRVKGADLYDRVWKNLQAYSWAGADVYAKYIVLPDNSSRLDLQSFVDDAAQFGRPTLIGDIDLKTREVSDPVVEALAFLQCAARTARLRFQLGGLCRHSALGDEIQRRMALVASTMRCEEVKPGSVDEWEYLHKVAISKAKWQRRSWIKRTFHRWRPPTR